MMHPLLEQLYAHKALTQQQTREFFSEVITGNMDPIMLASALTALKMRGETPSEIAGAASALIDHASDFPRPEYDFADIVGTGGDGFNTLNISSASAIVAASCGAKVAKHGNRSVSSKSGSADLFREFGLNLAMSADTARACLDNTGLCFLFAPQYHAGIRHAMPVRTALKTRTLFNLLGPLANPARPTHILLGVYLPELVRPMAETLKLLGYQHALVVHGSGLDELALHGPTQIAELERGDIREYQLTPADFKLREYPISAIEGGEPAENKALIEALLAGNGQDAHRQAVAINSGALLKLLGLADSYQQGAQMAMDKLSSSAPLALIRHSAELSQSSPEQV
ncbi:anthranilate phosphoribosyltransferase [Lacimicrobium alkaliphilum]|uniref:Anthranilate phosphoribosyltransferase n=2 Tax=Lacimicrobium alkaliphilum TaxID=1526571 RepID=A0A0U2JJ32_9ALTE|nr:anthranilate phosphoribosyltransferase [Lacimicrobium alkaliphilum]ALS98758.1 anthranilate phosphoribosyltransferase [Lacimicrobium alkaliphilum]